MGLPNIKGWEIDVANMIHDLAVDFLRNPLVKAPIACFHVEYRYVTAFCRISSKATVGIPQNQHGVRLLSDEDFVCLYDNQTDCLRRGFTRRLEKMVGRTHPKIVEKYLV